MKTLPALRTYAASKPNFATVANYLSFAQRFLDFTGDKKNIQAEIVSRNENHYQFLQWKKDGDFNVTRPLNGHLLYSAAQFPAAAKAFQTLITSAKHHEATEAERAIVNRTIYTAQQAIGATLDSLPAGQSNTARKINGDLFERLIRL